MPVACPNITWPQFSVCNDDPRGAFEDMTRRLFHYEYLKSEEIPHSDHANPGVEVLPILEPNHADSSPRKRISFQSKYFEQGSADYSQIQKSAKQAVKYYKGSLDVIYLFCNKTLTTTTKGYKSAESILSDADIELRPVSNHEVLDIVAKYPEIANYFFRSRMVVDNSPINTPYAGIKTDNIIGSTSAWERLDFSYQRSISHAIMGYRLTPADVESCPRFPQVEKIAKQLMLVDYVIVQGETGCGKSISVYQAAYDLYQQNWQVYLYKSTEDQSVSLIPNNSARSLYIIDDAQRLSDKVIDTVTAQARPNIKILMAKTISATLHHDTILLTNRDAVKILYNNFLARKQEITPIVHQCDNYVGVNFLELPIERRLEEAKEAATPWQFNYTLRGGWQTMKEQYQTIYAHHNCGLLAAAIALFQIMQLDNSVNYYRLCDSLQHLDATLKWDEADLRYLVEQKIVLSVDEVRIVHLESAAVIVAQFLQYSSTEKKNRRVGQRRLTVPRRQVSYTLPRNRTYPSPSIRLPINH